MESTESNSRLAVLPRAWRRYDGALKARWPRGRWVAHGATALFAVSLLAAVSKAPDPMEPVVATVQPSLTQVDVAAAIATVQPTATPEATPSATATPTPTPEPTEEATEEPTEEPEPVPTVSRAEKSWLTFTTHVGASAPEFVAPLTDLSAAATDIDLVGLKSSSTVLRRMATTELTWLGKHPPAACYSTVHELYSDGLKELKSAASSMLKFLTTYDIDLITDANDSLVSGTDLLQESTTELYLVDCS